MRGVHFTNKKRRTAGETKAEERIAEYSEKKMKPVLSAPQYYPARVIRSLKMNPRMP
jgi:hypothetical protein